MTNMPSAANAANKAAIIPTTIFSKEVRRMLGLSLHGWENVMVVALIIAGFFALIAGAATWAVVRLQRAELTESQNELDKYKLTVKGQVADAKKEGLEAGKAAGEANIRASEAKERAAKAELELAKMKRPRKLDTTQFANLVQILRPFGGKSFWIITEGIESPGNPNEQELLSTQLSQAFVGAGWVKVASSSPDGSLVDPERQSGTTGCQIAFKANSATEKIAALVISNLTEAGIDCDGAPDARLRENHIVIEVGKKL
jgi:hypothetical protein